MLTQVDSFRTGSTNFLRWILSRAFRRSPGNCWDHSQAGIISMKSSNFKRKPRKNRVEPWATPACELSGMQGGVDGMKDTKNHKKQYIPWLQSGFRIGRLGCERFPSFWLIYQKTWTRIHFWCSRRESLVCNTTWRAVAGAFIQLPHPRVAAPATH